MKTVWNMCMSLYILLYFGYFWWIGAMHSRFNAGTITALVLPVVVLIVLYLLQRKVTNRATRIGLVICILICTGGLYQMWVHEQQSYFTMGKWIAKPEERVWMVDDLLKQYDFIGMDVLTIESMLGNETDTSYPEASKQLVYYLGNEPGSLSIDSEWLVFDVNEDSVVTNAIVMRD
ncbi:hypothetical protein [Sporosarcina sp. NPDC096371]|uniref:hypothetical protein n=1 Tax=Sporosarcina sp. NPDC096371 TaxID=3364530 RepID=UPI00381C0EB6